MTSGFSFRAEEQVGRIKKALNGSTSNGGPKHQINTAKIRALGMTFGGEALLRSTVKELIEFHQVS